MKHIWYCYEHLYSKEECNNIRSLVEKYSETGIIDVPAGNALKTSEIKHVWYHAEIKDALDKMVQSVININTNVFGFDLYPLTSYDSVHLNTYSNQGRYDWHVDGVIDQTYDYKITAILNLTDEEIEGGDFQIHPSNPESIETFKKQGSLLVFPSFLQHRVTPVTKGIRTTLAMWMSGPVWR